MLFEPTQAIDAKGIEFEREKMFEHEQTFSFHEAEAPGVSVHTAHLGRSRLCRVRSTGHTVSLREPEYVTVLLPHRGQLVVETATESFSARPGDMLLFTPNARVTHVVADSRGRFESHCALVDIGDLIDEESPSAISMERYFAGTGGNRGALALKRLVGHLFDEGFLPTSGLDSDRARDAADVLLAETLGHLVGDDLGTTPALSLPSRQDHHLVRQAEELMRERYREALSTREIAKRLGVSSRRVQIAFENARSAPPLGVLRTIRLDIARQRILDSREDETVTDIAMDCGFFHLGRFSRAYAQAFGETPSQSLRRNRRT
ncbi:MAG: helix-turn-helix transcriptional regulator [Bauldia sp.]|nr:helix-turn-helix transcriptional regulator [Bauldia sp.]